MTHKLPCILLFCCLIPSISASLQDPINQEAGMMTEERAQSILRSKREDATSSIPLGAVREKSWASRRRCNHPFGDNAQGRWMPGEGIGGESGGRPTVALNTTNRRPQRLFGPPEFGRTDQARTV